MSKELEDIKEILGTLIAWSADSLGQVAVLDLLEKLNAVGQPKPEEEEHDTDETGEGS